MFAIGHLAIAYLTAKTTSKTLKTKINIPLLFAASVLPDTDLLLRFLNHRGPTHSLITMTALMTPFFIKYRKKALPYYAVLLSHSLIGDFFTGGIELFWPISPINFGALNLQVTGLTVALTEFILFITVTIVMFKLKDLQTLLKPNNHNLYLIIAFGAVLGPLLVLGRNYQDATPTLLIIPSLFWLGLFAYSLIVELRVKLSEGW